LQSAHFRWLISKVLLLKDLAPVKEKAPDDAGAFFFSLLYQYSVWGGTDGTGDCAGLGRVLMDWGLDMVSNSERQIEVAVNGSAALIVTGDADLLALHPFQRTTILSPADYLKDRSSVAERVSESLPPSPHAMRDTQTNAKEPAECKKMQ
jgi:hypothetical protein